MSYQGRKDKFNKYAENSEDIQNLNEERKKEIMKELHEEMDKLKVKYMLDEKDKSNKIKSIDSLESLTNRTADNRQFFQNYEEPNRERQEPHNEAYYNKKESDRVTIEYKGNNEEICREITPRDDTLINSENFENNLNYSYPHKSKIQSLGDDDEGKHLNYNYDDYNFRSSVDNYCEENSFKTGNYEMFDKAKENLLKIKNQLDDMDQYDYRNRINKNRENILNNNTGAKREYDIDDYLEEEEKPKNYEEEISMSMSKSLREETQPNNPHHSQYKFNAPYVSSVNNISRDIENHKRHYNTQYPDSNRPSSSSRLARQTHNCSRQDMFRNDNSKSASKEKNKNSPYFKKMVREYNPKYKKSKSKEKFEKLKAEIAEKFVKEHTFKPNVNYNNIFTQNPDKPSNESKEEIYRRLAIPKNVQLNQRQKEKEQVENLKLQEECTFKPTIKPLIEVPASNDKVENRLYKLAEQMKEKREKLKREYQEDQVKDFSFNPIIDTNSKQLMLKYENSKPIHQRYEDVIKNKNMHLQNMRCNLEKNERSFYKPEINSKSKDIVQKKLDRSFNGDLNLNIHERLYKEGTTRGRKTNYDDEDKECTFSPNLCYSTISPGGNIDDFLERQKIYEDIKKERLERKLSKSIELNQYTFKPKINLTSDILMKADHLRANEDIKDKVDRLYKDNFEKLKSRKEQLEKFYYAQYDFKPKINEISRYVGKDHTLEELHTKKESEKVKSLKEKYLNDAEICTFKPKINKDKFENVHSNYKPDENILQRIQNEVKFKNEKVEEIKTMIEERDMQECKFQPDIKSDMPNYDSKEPIVIKGFAKYVDQMEKARKAKRDKEDREKEVFITGENWSRDNLITVPQPFNLSYQKVNKSKQDEVYKKSKAIQMKECTFKPATNESKNKEIIKMILKN